MAEEAIVRVENVTLRRGERVIFDNISLSIFRGSVTAIMGPSGCGKTTLLKLITGQLLPDSGRIFFEDSNLVTMSKKSLYAVRRKMGMLFQSGALFNDMNVFDNIAYPLREHTRFSPSLIRTMVLIKLEAVGLRGAENLMPAELSGGMGRRVALARAMVLDPMLLCYDEPFTGQDPISLGILVKLIRELNDASAITSILVSHDVEETCSIADRIILLANRKVLAEGEPDTLIKSDNPLVRQFLQGLPDGPIHFRYPATPLAEDLLGESHAR